MFVYFVQLHTKNRSVQWTPFCSVVFFKFNTTSTLFTFTLPSHIFPMVLYYFSLKILILMWPVWNFIPCCSVMFCFMLSLMNFLTLPISYIYCNFYNWYILLFVSADASEMFCYLAPIFIAIVMFMVLLSIKDCYLIYFIPPLTICTIFSTLVFFSVAFDYTIRLYSMQLVILWYDWHCSLFIKFHFFVIKFICNQ